MSIPGYTTAALARFQPKLGTRTDQPHTHELPKYESTIQYAKEEDTAKLLDAAAKQFVQ